MTRVTGGRQPTRDRHRLVMAVTIPLGVLLFLLGQIGGRTGWITLPFDPHHVLTQLGGGALLLYGLSRWR